MLSSIFLSIPLLSLAASAVDLNSIPLPGVNHLDTGCAAQAVLDTCISSTTAIATACALTDYACLCQKNTDILTCFNNCPNDPRLSAVRSTQASYCANASAYPSSSSTVLPPNSMSSMTMSTQSSVNPTSSMTMSHPSTTTTPSTSLQSSTGTSTSSSPTASATSGSSSVFINQFVMLFPVLAILFS
ncbi:putative gpi anchored serine-threonine rich protein [Erysiphe necator]|uniref:Putative gpi anchored serine-threonine rich protein n=1 Tax=Uncinula necator TaxID=52586 RepID=A0A0B1P9Z3_UNCNE|nr:putative gpi anchored serine-threonine rich protein [Erysiphe necator]